MSQPTSTLGVEEMAETWHLLSLFNLDVQGFAEAFAFLHGHGPSYDIIRTYPPLGYDSETDKWRTFDIGTGWMPKRSILLEMEDIISGCCSLEAKRTTDDTDKAEAAYRKLRQKHLRDTDKAIKAVKPILDVDKWDFDDMSLGLPTGEYLYVTPTNPQYAVHQNQQYPFEYITKTMACEPRGRSRLWSQFLRETCGNDVDLEEGLQVWTAAAMMPGNIESKAHIAYGDGNTGKTTFLKTVQAAMGDYAGTARASVFTSEKEFHPAELMPFVDYRMVMLPELPRGALRSDLLKVVSGGDSLSVRGMRENPRAAKPTATLWFSCNELPSIRLVDNALKRRLMIWPFDHTPAKVDVRLGNKLQEEEHLSAVVSWLVDGLKAYVRILASGEPMPVPAVVANATAEYFLEADNVGQWRDAMLDGTGETPTAALYDSFHAWCESSKRKPLSSRSFSLWMGRHYTPRHTRTGNVYPVTVRSIAIGVAA